MDAEIQLWIGLGCCTLYSVIAFIFYKYPPKKINHFYGYRTKRSMANPEIWKDANSYSSLMMLKLTLAGFIFPIALYFLWPEQNVLISITVTTLLLLSVMWFTEKYLNTRYNKDGSPKSQN